MRIYHIDRDYTLTAKQQRKILEKQYTNFYFLWTGYGKIHFMADDKGDEK